MVKKQKLILKQKKIYKEKEKHVRKVGIDEKRLQNSPISAQQLDLNKTF